MKLSEMVIFLFVFSLCVVTGIPCCNSILKTNDLILKYKRKSSAAYFISESFKNTCKGKGFENLNIWQSSCRAMFNLEYIGWADAEDFMIVDYSLSQKKLFYGKWESVETSGDVYCRRKR